MHMYCSLYQLASAVPLAELLLTDGNQRSVESILPMRRIDVVSCWFLLHRLPLLALEQMLMQYDIVVLVTT